MIGVLAKPHQVPIVEEFFELFKTPWEWFHPGRRYSAVVATIDDVPEIAANAEVLVLFGSATTAADPKHGVGVAARRRGGVLDVNGAAQPIYGDVAPLTGPAGATPFLAAGRVPVALRFTSGGRTVIRVGYDLFDEVHHLLSEGQPVDRAGTPTLDVHIEMLRGWIVDAGAPLLEMPPQPAGHGFVVCLTHDIDFIGIRQHLVDHSMWGFLYRSTVGSLLGLVNRRITLRRAFRMWRAAMSLPFVYLGLVKDFWEPFDWYLRVEKSLPATYFLIPFKRRAGERVTAAGGSRRATAYDVDDVRAAANTLLAAGCELGVHGIDAWHSVERGRAELQRLAAIAGTSQIGVRMHWLLQDAETARVLEQAGYIYDSSRGYNETIGFRNGTAQVYRPLDASILLELPMHIQDGALFFPDRLGLTEAEAGRRCDDLIDGVRQRGGVVTMLWHDRSHGPERFWGDFYAGLVERLRATDAWFGTAAHVVEWFSARRAVQFERAAGDGVRVSREGAPLTAGLTLRAYTAGRRSPVDRSWNGAGAVDFDADLTPAAEPRAAVLPSPLQSSSVS